MIWFTSDTHFNHKNIIKYSSRPFDNIVHMEECITKKWNSLVTPNDTVYHLGDFSFSKDKNYIDKLLNNLNGKKYLIKGNHDRKEVYNNSRWIEVVDYKEINISLKEKRKQKIVMSHYPFRSWSQMHRGSWMLHGHCHGSLKDIGGKTMDVGVDVHNYSPISLKYIENFMKTREIITCDHHER